MIIVLRLIRRSNYFCYYRRPCTLDRSDSTYPVRVKHPNGQTHDIYRGAASSLSAASSSGGVPFASMPSLKLCGGVAIRKADNADNSPVDVKARSTYRVKKYRGDPLAEVQKNWDSMHIMSADDHVAKKVKFSLPFVQSTTNEPPAYVDLAHTRACQSNRLKEADAAIAAAPAVTSGDNDEDNNAAIAAAPAVTSGDNEEDNNAAIAAAPAVTSGDNEEDNNAACNDDNVRRLYCKNA